MSPKTERRDVQALKRRVAGLARLDLDVLHLTTGPVLLRGRRIREPRTLVAELKKSLRLDRATLIRLVELDGAPIEVDARALAIFHRDLRALADPRLLKLATDNRRTFARFGRIDADWLREKEQRLLALTTSAPPATWIAAVIELAKLIRGRESAPFDESELVDAFAKHPPEKLAPLALAFRGPAPWLGDVDPKQVLELQRFDITLAEACHISKLAFKNKRRPAKVVADGLSLELIDAAIAGEFIDQAMELDAPAARAYITWTLRLKASGIAHKLPSKLFESLPKNEDLAVLTHCLLESQVADPIASFDATIGLFRRLPSQARGIITRLRGTTAGAGRKRDPEFAAWLADDALLDRAIHVAELAGQPGISRLIRSDFEAAAKRDVERLHLDSLSAPSERQERRREVLARPIASSRARTQRRLRARIDRLLPAAYQRELDATFAQILRQGWNLEIAKLTPAWRDAVRFWLVAEDNRAQFETLLREAAKRPGQSIKDAFPANAQWIANAKFDVAAWLAPRRTTFTAGAERFTIHLEEDPLEVLRMGIPFGTCLAITGGENAGSTITNAIDANKRVIYVRNSKNSIVARKLIAIATTNCIVGYRLYESHAVGEVSTAIHNVVTMFCQGLAADVGVTLASVGTPAKLAGGFWYDDGEVPFAAGTETIADYCRALGLGHPRHENAYLDYEALGWRAQQDGDAHLAARVLSHLTDGAPAAHVLGEFAMSKLELRAAVKIGRECYPAGYALLGHLAKDEPGMLFALEVSKRLPYWMMDSRFSSILCRFPPSPKIAVALVDIALHSMKKRARAYRSGPEHLAMDQLPFYFDDVTNALDLLDAFEPVLLRIEATNAECRPCAKRARATMAWALRKAYARRPDPNAIVVALRSRRRSGLARECAKTIGAPVDEGAPDYQPIQPRDVVDRWLETQTLFAFAKQTTDWAPRFRAVEREAAARGVSTAGMFEQLVDTIAGGPHPEQVLCTDGLDQFEPMLARIVACAAPARIAKIFLNFDDALSLALFRRALERETPDRIEAILAEIQKALPPENKRRRTFYEWLAGIGDIRGSCATTSSGSKGRLLT